MALHHKRATKRNAVLNMVSLMDIFTILVFFLLVNSTEVEVLPNADKLKLPESIADQRARETVVVMITNDDLLPPDTTGWNPINGHERNITDGSDLQYACIFPLPASRVYRDG